jgi:hypothetical protein
MENLSHSGINIDTLQEKWNELIKMPFPRSPKNEQIRKIFADFVEWDGHVAGIVSSFLQGEKVDKKLIYIDENINNILDSIKPLDSDEEKEISIYLEYKKKLDLLIRLVLKLYE